MFRTYLALATSLATLAASPLSLATNGYFGHGYGTINKGMAGAGTAWAQDAIAAATNPAGMAFVGDRLDLGVEIFSPRREYTVSGAGAPQPSAFYLQPGTRESDNEYFPIPHFGYNREISSTQTLGVSVFANGGMNTEYDRSGGGTYYADKAGVDLMQLFVAPTWTWRFNSEHAIGISLLGAIQRFEATGVGSFAAFSSDASKLSDNGHDTSLGWGIQLGWQGQVTETLRAGASWRSILYMQEFDGYEGLFAEQGGFDIPQMFNAGLAWSALPEHTFLVDLQYIRYGEVSSIGNALLPNLGSARLGDDRGAGFGWDDMLVSKLGWQWQQSEQLALRAGLSYGEQPIPDSEVLFNILAPGVQEWHLTAGFSREISPELTLSGMFFYSPEKTVSGQNPLGPGQEIELQMHQIGASVSLGWRF